MKYEIKYGVTKPKLTITKDRVTFKFPDDYTWELKNRCINLGNIIVTELQTDNMFTLRGRFFLLEDKFVIQMCSGFGDFKRLFVEE